MDVVLEIKNSPFAGRRIEIKEASTVTVGRADQATFSLSHDTFMSSVHFALENTRQGCRLADRNSSNGTFLNGARITEAFVRDGDEIVAGHTTFVVRTAETMESRSSGTPAGDFSSVPNERNLPVSKNDRFSIGSWSFGTLPSGWETIEQHGIRRMGKNIFPSNAVVSEEALPTGKTLQEYVELQTQIMQSLLPEMKAGAPTPATFAGAEEALDMQIRHTSEDGQQVLQRQLYAKAKQQVGVLTFTTIEKDFPNVQTAFENILSGASFKPQ